MGHLSASVDTTLLDSRDIHHPNDGGGVWSNIYSYVTYTARLYKMFFEGQCPREEDYEPLALIGWAGRTATVNPST